MSGWAIVGIVAIGVAIMLTWTNVDLGQKQAGPAYRTIDYEVLRVEKAYKARTNTRMTESEWRVYIRFVDPFTNQPLETYSTTPEKDAPTFRPGERRKGLYAPQWPYPELTETAPDVQPERNFTRVAAMVLGLLGALILVFAWKTGRLFS